MPQLSSKESSPLLALLSPEAEKERGHSGFSISMLYSVQGATFESIGRLVDRDEASLDMFWLRDETIEESDNLPDPDVLALEAEIDQFVYSLYGLTREEIAIIEGSLQERTGSREVADDAAVEG